MKPIIALTLLALSACVSLNDAQSSCSSQNADYSAMWRCIEGRVASGQAGMMNNEMGIRYMEYGRAIDAEYRAGRVTSPKAKILLSEVLVQSNADYDRKYGQSSGVGALGQAMQNYGNSMQQNRPVNCTSRRIGNVVRTSCN